MKRLIVILTLFPILAFTESQQQIKIAEFQLPENTIISLIQQNSQIRHFSKEELNNNQDLTHYLLSKALLENNVSVINNLLRIYQYFPNKDPILIIYSKAKIAFLNKDYQSAIKYYREILAQNPNLNPVRVELAIALFHDQQYKLAEEQFYKALNEPNLPKLVNQKIKTYLDAIKYKNEWKFNFSTYYLNENNVNSVSKNRNIESTGYVKNDDMLPKKAHGIAINANITKDLNLFRKHYLAFENSLFRKSYWDNHDYDDMTNRSSLGYRYKITNSTISLLPFYEKRWYGNKSYYWANGARLEFSHWLNNNWQISNALEWKKSRYFETLSLNGHTKLISSSLAWIRTPQQVFYIGGDFNQEVTPVKQYSSDTQSIRFGWGQEWNKGMSSSINLALTKRKYKDLAKLGGLIPLGKIREDNIYHLNLTLWKRDWYWLGITPKLQLHYLKQKSNLPTMFSYTDKTVRIIFEKSF